MKNSYKKTVKLSKKISQSFLLRTHHAQRDRAPGFISYREGRRRQERNAKADKKMILSLLILLLLSIIAETTMAVPSEELEQMLNAMRATPSYGIFANAIASSDLRYEALQGSNFTFFAPTNASLSLLDLNSPASFYTLALRSHVLPLRFSLSDLGSLPNSSSLPTLLSCNHRLLLSRRTPYSFSLNGVDVALPGLFYSTHLAAHGLATIIEFNNSDYGFSSLGSSCNGSRFPFGKPPEASPPPESAIGAGRRLEKPGWMGAPSPSSHVTCSQFNCMVQPPLRRRRRPLH